MLQLVVCRTPDKTRIFNTFFKVEFLNALAAIWDTSTLVACIGLTAMSTVKSARGPQHISFSFYSLALWICLFHEPAGVEQQSLRHLPRLESSATLAGGTITSSPMLDELAFPLDPVLNASTRQLIASRMLDR